MSGPYAYTPTIWPSVLTVLLLSALSVYAWRRRSVPGALPFAIACLFGALWAAGSVMEFAAVDMATKISWVKFQAMWQVPVITANTCFVLEYAWPGRWLTHRNLVLLSIAPLLIAVFILTDDFHHLTWRGFVFNGSVVPQLSPTGWMGIAYGFGVLGAVNLIVFGWLFLRSPQHRWPVTVMLIGQIGGRVLYMLERVNILHAALPLDMLGMASEFLMYTIPLFGFRLFDPIPLAQRTVIAQLHAGMLVLDPQGRVASLNPAAEQIFGAPARRLRGQRISDLLPAYQGGNLPHPDETEIELSFPEGHPLERTRGTCDGVGAKQKVRHYALAISHLKDWRGLAVGRLLLLRDVTAQKQAQAQVMEQQRTVATLQERERLARELHDSLGQTLAAAHLQASSARLLLARGETTQTDECLERLADMALAAEADVREYLLGAKTAFATDLPFFVALRQYLARFTQQYGLPVELSVPPQLEEQGLGPTVEMQLLRIVQEALSNVRKHAHAKNAQVIFAVSGRLAQITIRDDGQGFDPAAVAVQQGQGFGLQAMRERAEALGGCLQVISQLGQGTQVVVQVPVNGEQ